MSERSDLDRVLGTWFEDGPTTMPDRVVDLIAARIDRQPQRRGLRLRPRRSSMRSFQILGGIAAALVIVVAGWSLLPRLTGVGGVPTAEPTTSTVPSPAPTASAAPGDGCDSNIAGCAGVLAAGVLQHSKQLQPALSLTPPSSWNNVLDTPTIYELDPQDPSIPDGTQIFIWTNVVIGDQTPDCAPIAKFGLGNNVSDWMAYVTRHPGLTASTPVAVTLGGATGKAVDLSVKDTWTATCTNNPAVGRVVQFILGTDPVAGMQVYGAAASSELHLVVLDVAGRTIVIQAYLPKDAVTRAAAMAQVQPLLASFRFGP